MMAKTAAQRKQAQRERDRAAGFTQLNLKVPIKQVAIIKRLVERYLTEQMFTT